MSIQTELTRITNAKAAIKAAVEGKGVTVPDGTLLDGMSSLIESIEAGGSDYIVEKHVVTFAEEIACAAGASVELCDTAIQTPLCIGMITYGNYTQKNAYAPALAFGVSYKLINRIATSGHAFATTDSSYTKTSKGYVRLYTEQQGIFNSQFNNGLFVKDGKLLWNNKEGLGFNGSSSARFLSGAIYIFFILGASA